ncbi:MAG: AraC family transcriptional regulator [Deltaproteobacteria bacterium]|nr:AraC family transcriptional regulator [Deltaproteobacteria bacterium]
MTENVLDEIKKQKLRQEYISRINRVIDYIEANLDGDLSLEKLAKIASFSRFHFHRIFGAMVGETLNHFIGRVRVEKAASQLVSNPAKSITEIALDYGFSSSATFSRAFKEAFSVSPSEWREGKVQNSKICKTNGKNGQSLSNTGKEIEAVSFHIDEVTYNPKWRIEMKGKNNIEAKVEVKDMPELTVAYVRHIGPYAGMGQVFESMFNKLMTWAGPRGLIRFPETQMLSVYHDDPGVTDEGKLRTSMCITVPEDTEVDGEIGKMNVTGGKFAVCRFELATDQYSEAWNAVMGGWMPESGYQPDDRVCYELYQNDPKQHPEGKCIVDICVPVKPL